MATFFQYLFRLIAFALFLTPLESVQGQTAPDAEGDIFAYALNDKPGNLNLKLGAAQEKQEDYRYQVARKVLADLIEARGEKRMQQPDFTMNNGERYVAWMNPKKIAIGLEEKAYDICTSFGKDSLNAMAALLGHELTHYYDKHDWTRHFTKEIEGLDATQRLKALQENLKNETQADYLGGFLGYSAGYNTLGIMPKVLDKVYQDYQLPAEIPGYPSLADRRKIARESMEKLEDLANVFEMANYLTALEEYDDAIAYFRYVLNEFQSREIYNNLGVTIVLEALTYFDKDEVKFGYPVELDAESRLGKATRNMGFSDRKELRVKLLQEAIQNFESAVELDKDYAIGYLNMGCAYALLANVEDASYFARKARKIAQHNQLQKTEADVQILLGIIADKEGSTEEAGEYFEKATRKGSALAAANKAILEGKSMEYKGETPSSFDLKPEQIENLLLDKFLEELEVDKSFTINSTVLFAVKNLPHSKIMVNLVNNGERYTLIHLTAETYEGASGKGVKIGQTDDAVQQQYGPFERSVEYARGRFLVYPKKNLFFISDGQNKVKQWSTFRVKKK